MRLQEGKDSLFCDYCNQVYTPPEAEDGVRILDQQSSLACPVCAAPLAHAAMAHHRVLYCAHCHGSLIKMEEFSSLLGDLRSRWRESPATPHPPEAQELRRRMNCPQCSRPMDTHYYSGPGNIVIDDCSRCELDWLDAGELMTMVRAPDHSYTRQSGDISDYRPV
jgi:Zn-finger nucleic acid-binding protein